jgi:hypothetical protein
MIAATMFQRFCNSFRPLLFVRMHDLHWSSRLKRWPTIRFPYGIEGGISRLC